VFVLFFTSKKIKSFLSIDGNGSWCEAHGGWCKVLLESDFNWLEGLNCESEEVSKKCEHEEEDSEEAEDCLEDEEGSDPASSAVSEGGDKGVLHADVTQLGIKTEVVIILDAEVVTAVDHGDISPVLVSDEVEDTRRFVIALAVVIITERREGEDVIASVEGIKQVKESNDDHKDRQEVQPRGSFRGGQDGDDTDNHHHNSVFVSWGEEVGECEENDEDSNNDQGTLNE